VIYLATISIFEGVALDGVMQGPGRADDLVRSISTTTGAVLATYTRVR
jgi:hypothetical protein